MSFVSVSESRFDQRDNLHVPSVRLEALSVPQWGKPGNHKAPVVGGDRGEGTEGLGTQRGLRKPV
jgi:hypothetical protein